MDKLVLTLQQTLEPDPNIREPAQTAILEFQSSNLSEYCTSLLSIISNTTYPFKLRNIAMVNLWRPFPPLESKQVKSNPLESIPPDITQQLIKTSFSLLNNPGDTNELKEISFLASTLYGRISSWYVHINFQDSIIQKLCNLISKAVESSNILVVNNALNSLQILLEQTSPEDEETTIILNTILQTLSTSQEPIIAQKMLNIISSISEVLREAFEDDSFTEAIGTLFISFLEKDPFFQSSVYDAFDSVYQICDAKNLIYALHEPLTQSVISTFECYPKLITSEHPNDPMYSQTLNNSKNAVLSACNLFPDLVELEEKIPSLNNLSSNFVRLVTSFLNIIATVDSPECDLPDSEWTPARAALKALGQVIALAPDEVETSLLEPAQSLLSSTNFGQRAAGAALLFQLISIIGFSDITSYEVNEENGKITENSPETIHEAEVQARRRLLEVFKHILPVLLNLVNDESPRVRCYAIMCMKTGFSRLSRYKMASNEMAESAIPVLAHMTDDPVIVSKTVGLAAALCSIPSLSKTGEILTGIFLQAINYSGSFSKSPFNDIADIIISGDEAPVLAFMPTVFATYEQACSTPELANVAHDLHNVMFAYIIRFGKTHQFLGSIEHLAQIFLGYIGSNSPYASDPLDLIGLLVQQSFEKMSQFLPAIITAYHSALSSGDEETIFSAADGISSMVKQESKNYLPQMNQFVVEFIPQLLEIVQNLDFSSSTRTNAINAISVLGENGKEAFAPQASAILSILAAFSSGLQIQMMENSTDAQLTASAITNVLLLVMELEGPESSQHLGLAEILFNFAADQDDDSIETFNKNFLKLAIFVSKHFSNEMLTFIQDNSEIGDKISLLADSVDEEIASMGKEVLKILGYQYD